MFLLSRINNLLSSGVVVKEGKRERLVPEQVFSDHFSDVHFVGFSHDGLSIVSCGGNPWETGRAGQGEVFQWDLRTQSRRAAFVLPSMKTMSAALSPESRFLCAACGQNSVLDNGPSTSGVMIIWDVATGRQVLSLEAHRKAVSCVVFQPQGKLVASGSYDSSIKLWDACTFRPVMELGGEMGRVCSIAFSANAHVLAAGGIHRQRKVGMISLWDVDRGEVIFNLWGHTDCVHCVAFSRDGTLLATGGEDGVVMLWDPDHGRALRPLPRFKSPICSVAFSPNGRIIAASDYWCVLFWDLTHEKELAKLTLRSRRIQSMAFSPDGTRLVTGDAAADSPGRVKVWNTLKLIGDIATAT